MEKKYTFVIDCDEVLRPLIRNMVDVYNKHFNDNKRFEDVTVMNSNTAFPKLAPNAPEWFFQEHGEETYKMRPPIDKAADALRILRKYGTVIIASYQSSTNNKIWTLEWFDQYGIEYDDVFFGADKRKIMCDFFIDDDRKYFVGTHATYGILVKSSHNKTMDTDDLKKDTYCKSIFKYDSLWEFANDFETIIKKHNDD